MGNCFLACGHKAFGQKIVLFIFYNTSGLKNFLILTIPVSILLILHIFSKNSKIHQLVSNLIFIYVAGFFIYLFFFLRFAR